MKNTDSKRNAAKPNPVIQRYELRPRSNSKSLVDLLREKLEQVSGSAPLPPPHAGLLSRPAVTPQRQRGLKSASPSPARPIGFGGRAPPSAASPVPLSAPHVLCVDTTA
eukprot:TRINITY_DN1254_c0_g1_i1.p2 TRINITY_DN1254_c0_g1~~TRINITY_DN1254_c0_g1_i1.p2  ORF type:complete len:109 (+),score=16.51 TRINITY_DN1254_c0_g1_i1:74-400(+)